MLMTSPQCLEIVKVSTLPSAGAGAGDDIPIINCRIYGDDECE